MSVAQDDPYSAYRSRPSPERLNAVVESLRPAIDHAVISAGGMDDPMMRQQARIYAAKAIESYDPVHGAGLPTWVSRNLMQLRRFRRQAQSPIKVPERVQLDAFTIERAKREIQDETGREADMLQVSDRIGMPLKRIRKVQSTFRRAPAEGEFGDAGVASGMSPHETDFTGEAMDYIYVDADETDRKIIEHMTGYGGNDLLEPQAFGLRFNLTPSQLSRRRAKLAYKLQDMERRLQRVGT